MMGVAWVITVLGLIALVVLRPKIHIVVLCLAVLGGGKTYKGEISAYGVVVLATWLSISIATSLPWASNLTAKI